LKPGALAVEALSRRTTCSAIAIIRKARKTITGRARPARKSIQQEFLENLLLRACISQESVVSL
jgi:hypothetical protein